MIMKKKLRFVNVVAYSNLGTRIQLTLSAETDDLRQLVADALIKIGQYGSAQETFLVYNIDSISPFRDIKE